MTDKPQWEKRVVRLGTWLAPERRGCQNEVRMLPADSVVVSLDSWIIQDGNYTNFVGGEIRAFALEFYETQPLSVFHPSSADVPSLVHLGDAVYAIVGTIVHVEADWWVLDVGVMAFHHGPPPQHVTAGTWVRGELKLGIDSYFYFENLSKRANAPSLIHDWQMTRIQIETAPFVELQPKCWQRDPAQLRWQDIDRTDAWADDQGRAEYLLHCTKIAGLPRCVLDR